MTISLRKFFSVAKLIPLLFVVSGGVTFAEEGASLNAVGTFNDAISGFTFNFYFEAYEDMGEDVGNTLFKINEDGGAILACSTHGGWSGPEGDLAPLTNIFCGNASRQRVSINNCKATVQVHGFVHSDYPYVTYSGSTTIDVNLKKQDGEWLLRVQLYTPKEKVTMQGKLIGDVFMSNCQ